MFCLAYNFHNLYDENNYNILCIQKYILHHQLAKTIRQTNTVFEN